MDELIVINKEKDYTSRDIVNIVSKSLNTKKVGHFGTLDPLACGVLVIGVNNFTKIGNFLADDKEYIAEVLIGTSTTTYDIEGDVINQEEVLDVDKDNLIKVINSFKKTYLQEVPIYSAVKVNGKKLYEYARENIDVVLPKKEVTISDIEFIDLYKKDNNYYFKFRCVVSKGTYIRSLINDMSKILNIPLTMSNLTRIRCGIFKLEDANTLEDIKNNTYKKYTLEDIFNCDIIDTPKNLVKIVVNGGLIPIITDKEYVILKNSNKNYLYKRYNDNNMKIVIVENKQV